MKTIVRLMLAACLVLPFAACKKHEEAKPVEAAPLTAPKTADDAQWKTYLQDVVTRNMGNITNSPFVYYLPAKAATESDDEYQGKYNRQLEQASNAMARGIVAGNLIAFASPDSARMGDLIVASFKGVQPDAMKGVRVLFIGAPADNERVKAAVAPTGVDYVFVEAK